MKKPALINLALAAATLLAPVARATVVERDATAQVILQEGRTVFIYPTNGTFTVTEAGQAELLLVGGGGGGGQYDNWTGQGGGGAGGVVTSTVTLATGTYTVEIGAGGNIKQPGQNSTLSRGGSTLFTAYGGGRGGSRWSNPSTGGNGASGGGGAWGYYGGAKEVNAPGGQAIYGDSGNLGHDGGPSTGQCYAGGGGGAGAVGGTPSGTNPGVGGAGVEVPIIGSGDDFWYGGGGAGWRYWDTTPRTISGGKGGGGSSGSAAGAGEDGKGGGGSGGAKGGSGIFIVAFARTATPRPDPNWLECTGGDEVLTNATAAGSEEIRIFKQNGTLTVDGPGTMEVLAVGGGGGGGQFSNEYAGTAGGGAGGVVHYTDFKVAPGTYEIVIGEGGGISTNGFPTKGLGITAFGGGAGASGSWYGGPGKNGASGGGGSSKSAGDSEPGGVAKYGPYANRGNAGGSASDLYNPGGGGGAGAPGGDGNGGYPGAGGDGYACSITGTETYYGGGGAGWRPNTHAAAGGKGGGGSSEGGAHDGQANTGGGGSGCAAGGSGVFIVRYHRKPLATVLYVR